MTSSDTAKVADNEEGALIKYDLSCAENPSVPAHELKPPTWKLPRSVWKSFPLDFVNVSAISIKQRERSRFSEDVYTLLSKARTTRLHLEFRRREDARMVVRTVRFHPDSLVSLRDMSKRRRDDNPIIRPNQLVNVRTIEYHGRMAILVKDLLAALDCNVVSLCTCEATPQEELWVEDVIEKHTVTRKTTNQLLIRNHETYALVRHEIELVVPVKDHDRSIVIDTKIVPYETVAPQHRPLIYTFKITPPRLQQVEECGAPRIKWWRMKEKEAAAISRVRLPTVTTVDETRKKVTEAIRQAARLELGSTKPGRRKVHKQTWLWTLRRPCESEGSREEVAVSCVSRRQDSRQLAELSEDEEGCKESRGSVHVRLSINLGIVRTDIP
ncbi:unnamed protein product [Heligmosomoides polygyrus]|uniref:Ig-like domain-containing protein n=1 Tax=Heligmosomoides polygyrus TaxID=6339 RepID=A0A183FWX8_HELPZ|nr:unnamed protein product [Heligmosomoides polygyrus]